MTGMLGCSHTFGYAVYVIIIDSSYAQKLYKNTTLLQDSQELDSFGECGYRLSIVYQIKVIVFILLFRAQERTVNTGTLYVGQMLIQGSVDHSQDVQSQPTYFSQPTLTTIQFVKSALTPVVMTQAELLAEYPNWNSLHSVTHSSTTEPSTLRASGSDSELLNGLTDLF